MISNATTLACLSLPGFHTWLSETSRKTPLAVRDSEETDIDTFKYIVILCSKCGGRHPPWWAGDLWGVGGGGGGGGEVVSWGGGGWGGGGGGVERVQSWFVITLWINIMITFLINLLLRCVTHLFGFKKIYKTLFNSNVIGHIKLAKPYFGCPNMRTPVMVNIVIYFFDTHLNEFGFIHSRHCWLSDWLNGISVVQIHQHCCLGLIFFFMSHSFWPIVYLSA